MEKTVLITGASSGIGKATAHHFARQGWKVAATMRTPEKETEFKQYPNVHLYRLDVTDPAQIDAAFTSVVRDFGKLDVVVNNAGYGLDGVFEGFTDADIQQQFDTNVFGLMRVTRAAIKVMRPQGGGRILQVASMGGRITFPIYSIYHGTKWAVEGFSESLHYELAPFNIRIKIIEPGAIKTDFIGRSRHFVMPTHTDAYNKFVAQVETVNKRYADGGEDPLKVARTIHRAATDSRKKLRYVVGSPAPLLLFLRRRLPETWYYGIVRALYKI